VKVGSGTAPSRSLISTSDWSEHRKRDAQMSVRTVRFDDSRASVKVDGELDMGTAAPLWAVLRSHMSAGRRFLRLDVSGLSFVDATALSGITTVHRELLASRGTLVVTGVRSLVGRVLHMTGLDEVLFVSGPRADDDAERWSELSDADRVAVDAAHAAADRRVPEL
jgi:anti-sigma B factor antagonist